MIAKMLGRVAGALAVAGLFLIPSTAKADLDFGVRGGFYNDADAGFLGAELLWGVTRQWFFNPNVEYVFVDNGDLTTLNLDFHYDLPTARSPFYVWAGGGPAVLFRGTDAACRRCNSDSETDLGLNLLGGVGFGKGEALRPYIQGKVILSDDTEAVLAVGLRFY
jgi:hypothetical protein